jgi:DNA helicase-2/ATP-dependent DNA helicase PcrA
LEEVAKELSDPDTNFDLQEDMAAWSEISRDITSHLGKNVPLDQFLQELQMRSKEPAAKPGTVTLMTIHGAKGREFDFVYVIGLAEDILPSFQSKKKVIKARKWRKSAAIALSRLRVRRSASFSAAPPAPWS